MRHDLRHWMSLCEMGEPPHDDIDYENEWEEILEYPDKNSPVPVEEQVKRALAASGAQPITLPGTREGTEYYVTNDKIIALHDDGTGDVEAKEDWIWNVDPENFYPNYVQEWNDEFWEYPSALYHATDEENVESILEHGLSPENKTRGLSNRGVGAAVFTTSDIEEAIQGSYGDFIFEIDMAAMAKLPDRPFVSEEPPIVESELRGALARRIGLNDFYNDVESGISPYTVIVHGVIPPQYLKLVQD